MKNREQLIDTNTKNATQKEIEELGNMSLNCCDKCGVIKNSYELVWLEYEETNKRVARRLMKRGYVAVCKCCFQKEINKYKPLQINNIKIKYSNLYNKWQCCPFGKVLEEFKRKSDAIKWAKNTKEFICIKNLSVK